MGEINYEEKMNELITQIQEENPNDKVTLFEGRTLDLGRENPEIKVDVVKIEQQEKDDEKKNIYTMQIFVKTKDGYEQIGVVKDNVINVDITKLQKLGYAVKKPKNASFNYSLDLPEESEYEIEEGQGKPTLRETNGTEKKDEELEQEKKEDKEKKQEDKNNEYKPGELIELNETTFKLIVPLAREYGKPYYDKTNEMFVAYSREEKKIVPIKGITLDRFANSTNQEIHGPNSKGQHKHINAQKQFKIAGTNRGILVDTDIKENNGRKILPYIESKGERGMQGRVFLDIPLQANQKKVGSQVAFKDKTGERMGVYSGDRMDHANDEIDELEGLDIPDDITIKLDKKLELQDGNAITVKQFKQILAESIKETMLENGARQQTAEDISKDAADYMVDRNMKYKDAVEQATKKQENDYGHVPEHNK